MTCRNRLLILVTMLAVTLFQSGCVAPGNLGVSPTNLNFGSVPLGSTSSQVVTITNSSAAPLTITQTAVSGKGFDMNPPALPLTLAVGKSAQFTARFAPAAIGDTSGIVLITKVQSNSPQLSSGGASAAPSFTTVQATVKMTGAGVPAIPSITTQPASQTVTAGQVAIFLVVASGIGHLDYQWQKNGAPISGATSPSYSTPTTTTSDNGSKFTVVVSNNKGSVTSDAATLTVTAAAAPPSITTQPTSQTITAGQTATFSVTSTGAAPLSYQWRKNGTAIAGAALPTYTTPAEATSDNGSLFTVVVSNSAGSVNSNAAALMVNAIPPGQLTASASTLNFNSVNVGSSSTLGVTFSNTGSSNINISSVSISGAGYNASGMSTGLTLTPGQTTILNVTFAPASAGSATGTVSITSNASNSTASVSLLGTGVQPAAHSATLAWPASTTPTVTGYYVYRATVSGGYTTPLNPSPLSASTTQFEDSTVQAGQTYYYVFTIMDSSTGQSPYSNEVSGTIPTP